MLNEMKTVELQRRLISARHDIQSATKITDVIFLAQVIQEVGEELAKRGEVEF